MALRGRNVLREVGSVEILYFCYGILACVTYRRVHSRLPGEVNIMSVAIYNKNQATVSQNHTKDFSRLSNERQRHAFTGT